MRETTIPVCYHQPMLSGFPTLTDTRPVFTTSVGHSHWSRSIKILCSNWFESWLSYTSYAQDQKCFGWAGAGPWVMCVDIVEVEQSLSLQTTVHSFRSESTLTILETHYIWLADRIYRDRRLVINCYFCCLKIGKIQIIMKGGGAESI